MLWNLDLVRTYWDDWLRLNETRKGRQFLRPEVCRTYNFGEHVSPLFSPQLYICRSHHKKDFQDNPCRDSYWSYIAFALQYDPIWLQIPECYITRVKCRQHVSLLHVSSTDFSPFTHLTFFSTHRNTFKIILRRPWSSQFQCLMFPISWSPGNLLAVVTVQNAKHG